MLFFLFRLLLLMLCFHINRLLINTSTYWFLMRKKLLKQFISIRRLAKKLSVYVFLCNKYHILFLERIKETWCHVPTWGFSYTYLSSASKYSSWINIFLLFFKINIISNRMVEMSVEMNCECLKRKKEYLNRKELYRWTSILKEDAADLHPHNGLRL